MKRCILIIFLLPFLLFSQNDTNRIKYGIFLDFGLNSHTADFKKLPDCPSCSPGYRDGSGSGWAFGILYEYPVSKMIYAGMRASYYDLSAVLKADEPTTLIVNGVATPGMFQHTIETWISTLGIEPIVKVNPISNMFITAGMHLGTIIRKGYAQKEQIIEPAGVGTFLDSNGNDSFKRIRNVFSGDFQNPASIYMAPFAGISYEFPLNKSNSFRLEPEIFYYYGLTNIIDNDIINNWTVSTLRAGLAIKYTPNKEIKPINKYEKYEIIDTIKIESDNITANRVDLGKPITKTETIKNDNVILTIETISRTDTLKIPKIYVLNGEINAVGVDKNGTEIENPKLILEEFETAKLAPLLTYIFFDDNSTEIPKKYKLLTKQETTKFEIDSLYNNSTLEIYYNILNIIGKRLLINKDAKITLTDCIGGLDLDDGKNMSGKWAESIKQYLENIWGINDNRIKIAKRDLPENPSTPLNEPEKIEENRRVEISSNEYKIIEPVFIENIEIKPNIPIIRFKLSDNAEAGLEKWNIKAFSKSKTDLPEFNIINNGNIDYKVDWNLEKDSHLKTFFNEPIVYQLKLIDKKGNSFITKEKNLPLELLTIREKRTEMIDDYEIQKFSLILFDFDKSDIIGQNKKLIDLIKSRIKPESIIEIKGYTDRTGDDEYNLKLSERRANTTQSMLVRTDAETNGIGEHVILYDNNLPEGRFYCRTVEITVKTKIK